MSPVAARALEILESQLSRINARSVFRHAMNTAGVDPEILDEQTLRRIVPSFERSARLFADESTLTKVTSALWQLSGSRPKAVKLEVPIANEADVSKARLASRSLCREIAAPSLAAQKIATVVSELARNILKYAREGVIELEIQSGPARFVIRAIDRGPGIPNLEEILSGKYQSKTGMGLGLVGSKRMVDVFNVVTGKDGTRITIEVSL